MTITAFFEKHQRVLAMSAMLLVAFFWSVVETAAQFLPDGYSPVQTVWSRYLVHIFFMMIVLGPRQRTALIRTRCLGMQVSRAFLMIGMPFFFIAGVVLMPAEHVWLVFWSTSIMVLIASRFLLGERISTGLWVLCCIGWFGVWLTLGADVPPISWRLLIPVAMGFCYALYVIMTRIMRMESTYANLFHTALCFLNMKYLGSAHYFTERTFYNIISHSPNCRTGDKDNIPPWLKHH